MKRLIMALVIAPWILWANHASANYPHGFTTTNPIVGGVPMYCRSWDQQTVVVISNHFLPDVGMASSTVNGRRVIQLNPRVISHLPPIIRQFWFSHECAHHMLYPASNSEPNADCVAVKSLFRLGVLNSQRQVNQLAQQISKLPATVHGHLPGPARLKNMLSCMN